MRYTCLYAALVGYGSASNLSINEHPPIIQRVRTYCKGNISTQFEEIMWANALAMERIGVGRTAEEYKIGEYMMLENWLEVSEAILSGMKPSPCHIVITLERDGRIREILDTFERRINEALHDGRTSGEDTSIAAIFRDLSS